MTILFGPNKLMKFTNKCRYGLHSVKPYPMSLSLLLHPAELELNNYTCNINH